jgi:hypothetical protein
MAVMLADRKLPLSRAEHERLRLGRLLRWRTGEGKADDRLLDQRLHDLLIVTVYDLVGHVVAHFGTAFDPSLGLRFQSAQCLA